MTRRADAVQAALAVAVLAGLTNSLQTFLNGRLAGDLGSAALAATVNNTFALAVLLVVAIATGVPGRLAAAGRRPRWWHVLMAASGAAFVIISTTLAPKLGIGLLTVALVCGQSTAGLALDALGVNPSGRWPLSVRRIAGAALAIVAVGLGAAGGHGDAQIGLLLLGVAGGVGFALQQVSVGYVARATGEPLAGAVVAVAVAGLAIVVFALVSTGGTPPHGWSAPPGHWIGGFLGAVVVTVVARVVGTVGALRLGLALVAGQSIGALVLDIAAPIHGEAITPVGVISVLLTLVAVTIASKGREPVDT